MKKMREIYEVKGTIQREYMVAKFFDTEINTFRLVSLDSKITRNGQSQTFLDYYFGNNHTDISIKVKNLNEPLPSVIINLIK